MIVFSTSIPFSFKTLTIFSSDGPCDVDVNALALITGLTLSGNLPPCTSTIAGFLIVSNGLTDGKFTLSSRNKGGCPLIRA